MSGDAYRYNCSERPDTVSPYSDISGTGVVVGYIGSAGIVVLLIIFYYLVAYDAEKDPFQRADGTSESYPLIPFRRNLIDASFPAHLDTIRGRMKKSRLMRPSNQSSPKGFSRLQDSCIKCVLCMSDLQILSGISILVSGYIQLRRGISCYHWAVLTYLAWFSCLTHMACLTFLRNYLYNKPEERAWRLLAMAIILIMQLTALVVSGNYEWAYTSEWGPDLTPKPSDYAICYFHAVENEDKMALASTVFSALLLGLGFMVRVVKLHKRLSIGIVGKMRQSASNRARKVLRNIYSWCDVQNSPHSVKRFLIYRPMLSIFLASRIVLDLWTSMFFEVWWLCISFIWGVFKLMWIIQQSDREDNEWTFGQIVPVVLLAAPLLAIWESLYPGSSISTASPEPQAIPDPPVRSDSVRDSAPIELEMAEHSVSQYDLMDEPDYDYFQNVKCSGYAIFFFICHVSASTIPFSVIAYNNMLEVLTSDKAYVLFFIIFPLFSLVLLILNSILIETLKGTKVWRVLNLVYVLSLQLLFTVPILLQSFSGWACFPLLLSVQIGGYCFCVLLYIARPSLSAAMSRLLQSREM